jgi:hypothetical protein
LLFYDLTRPGPKPAVHSQGNEGLYQNYLERMTAAALTNQSGNSPVTLAFLAAAMD